MGRFLIKTEVRVFEAQNSAQLARLAKMGLVARDAMVKELPDGDWIRAAEHPDIGRLYQEQDTERTVIAALPPRPDGTTRKETTGVYWVKTDVSTVEVRGLEVLQRLYELGVVRRDHAVSRKKSGPFKSIDEHVELTRFFDELSNESRTVPTSATEAVIAATAEELEDDADLDALISSSDIPISMEFPLSEDEPIVEALSGDVSSISTETATYTEPGTSGISTSPRESGQKEVSFVISLTDEEIEYLQSQDDDRSHGEVSNVIMLSASDIEVIDDDDVQMLEQEYVVEVENNPVDVEDVILLSADDIEEFEDIGLRIDPLPKLDTPWANFQRTMNAAAHRVADPSGPAEPTWDLFRKMMDKPVKTGPSESSWHRFQVRLTARQKGVTPLSGETTWDRFRELMHTDEQPVAATTWQRFVYSMEERREARRQRLGLTPLDARDGAVAGEARIKSGIVRVLETTGPSVRVEGLEE